MTIELNLANLIFILIAMLGAFWALVKIIVGQYEKSLDARFATLTQSIAKDQEITRALERDLMQFKSDVPRLYLLREDYARDTATVQAAMQRDLSPIRQSLTRIEDFLLKK